MSKEFPTTFADFGLEFVPNKDCITYNSGSCHNNVTSKKDGKEYNVFITVDYDSYKYFIQSVENASTESKLDVFEIFEEESKAVEFLCERFNVFNCF